MDLQTAYEHALTLDLAQKNNEGCVFSPNSSLKAIDDRGPHGDSTLSSSCHSGRREDNQTTFGVTFNQKYSGH